MNRRVLALYHRLPGWARSCAATARGLQLSSWRYGPESDQLVAEALERDRWSPARRRAWTEQRLEFILERAARSVPYYRELWRRRRRRGDRRSWLQLENWPLLEKAEVQHNPEAFLAADCDPRRMFVERTSGTTGTPLKLYHSRRTLRARYAIYEARHRGWHGLSRRQRWAMFGGQMVAATEQSEPPFWVWNAAMRQLYVSCCHLSPRSASAAMKALLDYRVEYVWGHPWALDVLARAVEEGAARPIALRAAITNAEPLSTAQRARIEAAFGCAARDTYGMVELAAAAGECERGRMHLFPEFGWLEVLDGGRPAPAGRAGELVATGLLDADMPLVRYRTGDRISLAPEAEFCPCGRTLPLVRAIEGRADDVLISADGRLVGRLDPVFKARWPIRAAQIIQESLGRVRVKVVPLPGYCSATSEEIVQAIVDRLGPLDVRVEPVGAIPRGANGKFRAVVSRLTAAERESAVSRAAIA